MFDIGFFELTLIAIVALLVLGPERLPRAARMAGAFIAKIRRTATDLKIEISKEVEFQEMKERAQKLAEQSSLQTAKESIEAPLDKLQQTLSHASDDSSPKPEAQEQSLTQAEGPTSSKGTPQ